MPSSPAPAVSTIDRFHQRARLAVGVVSALIGVGALVEGRSLDLFGANHVPGPGFFPTLLSALLVILGLLLSGLAVLRPPVLAPLEPADAEDTAPEAGFSGLPRAGRVWVGYLAALVLLPYAGFLISMFVLVAYLQLVVERSRGLRGLLTVVLVPLCVYALFDLVLGVYLPAGSLFGG